MSVTIYTDGGCRGNPGPSSAGIWVPELNIRLGFYLGDNKTNNEAEYNALLLALHRAHMYRWVDISIFSDSKLMVEQMKGRYAVRAEKIIPLHHKASEMEAYFKLVTYNHIKREFNKEADLICNEVLDLVEAGADVGVTTLNAVPLKAVALSAYTLSEVQLKDVYDKPLRGGINT